MAALPDRVFSQMKAMNLYLLKSRPIAEVQQVRTQHQLRPLRVTSLPGFHFDMAIEAQYEYHFHRPPQVVLIQSFKILATLDELADTRKSRPLAPREQRQKAYI